jgi:hypothetical protein
LPSTIRSRTSSANSFLPRYNFKHQDIHLHLQQNCLKCKIGPSHQRPPRRRGHHQPNVARHHQRRNGNPFNLIRSRNGHVSWQMPHLHGHAHRPLDKRRLPTIHPKTSDGIQPQCIKENTQVPKLPPHSKLQTPNPKK